MAASPKSSSTPLIGAVSYLNTKPLVHHLDRFLPDCRVEFDLPSRLADRLSSGELDVALIPSVEYFRTPGYQVVSDACIACRGPVLSVKLLSRKPFDEIRTLALDEGSRTSVQLTRILLEQQHNVSPQLSPLAIGADYRATEADAVLLIGDRAIHADSREFAYQADLGDAWMRWSELPFVFAMWVGAEGRNFDPIAEGLSRSRDAGLEDLEHIAERYCSDVNLSPAACLSYLRDNLHFQLGVKERRGLALYFHHVSELESIVTVT